MKIKQEQGEGSRKVGTNLQIYDGLAIMKVEQVSQGKGYVRIGVDLKHTNKILVIKAKQVEQIFKKANLQNLDLKDDAKIKIINPSNARM